MVLPYLSLPLSSHLTLRWEMMLRRKAALRGPAGQPLQVWCISGASMPWRRIVVPCSAIVSPSRTRACARVAAKQKHGRQNGQNYHLAVGHGLCSIAADGDALFLDFGATFRLMACP